MIFVNRKRLKSLLRRAYGRGHDDGLVRGYRLAWFARQTDNHNRDTASPRLLRDIDEVARKAGL